MLTLTRAHRRDGSTEKTFLSKTKCPVTWKLEVTWCVRPRMPVQTWAWPSDSRCCKKPRKDPKRPGKFTRNCSTASEDTGHNSKWEWFLLIGDWHNWCRFWPRLIGMMKCITSASRLRPVPLLAFQIWPYGEGERAGQRRKHNSPQTCLSNLAFWETLMKIALALQGKEEVDKATLSSKMGTETLICFLCGDHKWQSWPFMNCSYGQGCRA